ncbi:SAV_915 family protein [Leucobacter komagatae]|uniref:SAV_915 family protein n=1 Tax=Leucobacter komagatae TaxID=55969 RepID=UPI001E482853|nr:SAV_915 family protein [Leucobacter komagatae]
MNLSVHADAPVYQTSQFRDAGKLIPPVLYLPMRMSDDGTSGADLRELPDGRRALLAYTALDRLALQCGEEQPWSLVGIEALAELKSEHKFDVVAFDPEIAPQLRVGGKLL